MRYLAANEIYSPQTETELSGSQTKSQELFKKIGLMLTGVAMLGLGYSIVSRQQIDTQNNAIETQKRIATEAKLGAFIWTGDFYLRSSGNKVSCNSLKCTNECSNAVECYSQALALEPSDTYAQARLEQAQKIIPEVITAAVPEDHSEEFKLIAKAQALIASGNMFCEQGECAEQVVNQALALNSLNSKSQDLLTQLAAESVNRAIKSRAEGNASALEENYKIALRIGVDPQYIAPLKAGLDVIKRSTSSVVIIDEHQKDSENKKSIGRVNNAALAQRLSSEHGYKKPDSAKEVLDISSFNKQENGKSP